MAANTPEGKVKAAVRKILDDYEGMYYFMPVPSGYGRTTLDFIGCYRRRFFAIETKAPGKKPTLRQAGELNSIEVAMGQTFVIDGVSCAEIEKLRKWLDMLTMVVPHDPDISPDKVNRSVI